MTATLTETVLPEGYTQEDVAKIHEHIDGLDEFTARTVIQFLPEEVDHLIPMPEAVNDDPKEALKVVANVRPDAVNYAAQATLITYLLAEAFDL